MATLFQLVSRVVSNATIKQNRVPLTAWRAFCSEASPKDKFDKMVQNNKVVVFMKGVPEQPMCGFSNAVVQILRLHGVQYEAHNVLADEDIRQGQYFIRLITSNSVKLSFQSSNRSYYSLTGIKEYTNWPTIPQVFINSEFVGGCDILLQVLFEKMKYATR